MQGEIENQNNLVLIDTFAVARTAIPSPDYDTLAQMGWQSIYRSNGDFSRYAFHSDLKSGSPRLTIYQNYQGFWVLKAEVSLSSWLNGSNVHFLTERDFKDGLNKLSRFVELNSGFKFQAEIERVSRVDYSINFKVDEDSIIPIISKIGKMDVPKYTPNSYKTTVYFRNSGKTQNKQFKIYSKFHEVEKKVVDSNAINEAKGLIRLEISHRKNAVYYLSKSLKLPNHTADHLLTKEISQKVIETSMQFLKIRHFLNSGDSNIESLFLSFKQPYAMELVSFLALRQKYGSDFYKNPVWKLSRATCRKYQNDCIKAGILFLE